jgi:hypothetical protein
MKYIGFVKEYNNIKEASSLEELISEKTLDTGETEKVIDYLKQGKLLLAWMGYFIDIKSKELIAPDSYYSDGIWVWPAYLPYYLNKYKMKLDQEFLDHIRDNNFVIEVSEQFNKKKASLEQELSTKLGG